MNFPSAGETGAVQEMQVRHVEGLANRNGPESCVGVGDCVGEALTGERAGLVLSREIHDDSGVPTLWEEAEDLRPPL